MKHIWSIICKKSIIDSDTNNITLSEALEEITFHVPLDTPLKLPSSFNFDLEITSLWMSTNQKAKKNFYMEVEFLDPDKKTINKFNQEIAFPENKKRLRTRIKISAITVTREGEYTFKIKSKEKANDNFKLLAEIPLSIVINRTLATIKK